ncbi:MAG: hypothetical protein C3F12_10490 [Candidatus Methylomirabilota bacterium]|nr:MAG: hypothetical protein C3F12_10490 [candidate division NC10 bacterium]
MGRNAQRMRWVTNLCLAGLLIFSVDESGAKEPKQPVAGPLITLYAPHREQYEVVLDTIELQWPMSDKGGVPAVDTPVMVYGARVVDSEASRAVVALSEITTLADLSAMTAALKAVNPGVDIYPVLFESGLPHSKSTRRLLTREVGLLVEEGIDVQDLVAGLAVRSVRSIPGVPGGYVVDASDPIATLTLAEALRERPGVRSAYPLLKRAYVAR